MRPRHKAAEYHEAEQYTIKIDALASMRPRHKAAEYRALAYPPTLPARCFNEAAA